ncbi:sigma-70 family RNA polymerase sigma factor [Bacillus cereus group sp. N6]|uniref:RNA polymerase sigma factor n=1 Tax=Bacillus cereus group sp. N6 TaxID=2794583 RepID=UPI0018F2A561|nr:sigma-70 family RNA polymerase sigma factor [Bacillus cereus group sp. N6]MBJ8108972.1 sigma-70 family RNA polymerase sigma factor [Bacillus cereus group sp. N6]
MANQYTSGWTEKDIEFLENSIGVYSFDRIAKKLGKTPLAVESKAEKLGISNTKLASGFITVHELAQCLGVCSKVVKKFTENNGLPTTQRDFRIKKKHGTKRLLTYIDIDNFWKWAEGNKDLINWYQLPKYALTPEPEWLEERRKEDYQKWLKRPRPWTPEQDAQLWHLFYVEGKPQKEIGEIMHRTKNGVEKRLKRLREQKLIAV